MGCGGSRMNPEHNAIPARLRPILWRRLEEIRGRCNGGGATNNDISKKELLCEGGGNERHSIQGESSFDLIPSFHQTQDCPPIPQKIANDPPTLLPNQVVKRPSNDHEITQISREKIRGFDDDGKVVKKSDDKEKGLDERGNNKETMAIRDDMVGFGSPSFRVYCKDDIEISNLVDDQEFDEYINNDNIIDCQSFSTSDESICSNDVSVKHLSKKGIRRMKFKKMMPKRGKYTFNMQSLYNFSCSSNNSHTNSHLLQKAAA